MPRARALTLGTAREFVYALPASLVTIFHVLAALYGLVVMIHGIADWDAAIDTYRLLILGLGLAAAIVGIAASAILMSRRSWWILVVPTCTIPCMLTSAFWYVYLGFGY